MNFHLFLLFMELLTPSYGMMIWVFLLNLLPWSIALIDVLMHRFAGENEKLTWALAIILVPVVGWLLYFAIGRRNRIKTK